MPNIEKALAGHIGSSSAQQLLVKFQLRKKWFAKHAENYEKKKKEKIEHNNSTRMKRSSR